jgi:hypothetical protein
MRHTASSIAAKDSTMIPGMTRAFAAIDEAEIANRVEIVQRRLVAAHQRRLLADCRRPQPRADAHRMRAGVERDAEHRRLGICEVPGLRRPYEGVRRRAEQSVDAALWREGTVVARIHGAHPRRARRLHAPGKSATAIAAQIIGDLYRLEDIEPPRA